MHQTRKKFALAVIGLVQHEQRVLRSLCWLSASRAKGYELTDLSGSPGPDIVIVDGDDADAIVEWHQFADRLKDEAHRQVPAVWVSVKRPSHGLYYHIQRPFVAARLLHLLDEITEKDMSFAHALTEKKESTKSADVPLPRAPSVSRARAQRRVLVVDDSLPVRKQLGIELKRYGAQVAYAESGEQALARVAQDVFDLILLDVVMPGTDGYQVCRSIKHNKATKSMPVVMLTGKSSPFDRVKGALAGCDTYLTKPVKRDTFDKVIQRYLGDSDVLAGNASPAY